MVDQLPQPPALIPLFDNIAKYGLIGFLVFGLFGYVEMISADQTAGYKQTVCIIHSSQVLGSWQSRRSGKSRSTQMMYRPYFDYTYTVDGKDYAGYRYSNGDNYTTSQVEAEKHAQQFIVGESYICWYDPGNPKNSFLVEATNTKDAPFLIFALLGMAVFIGRIGMNYAHRRRQLADRKRALDFEERQRAKAAKSQE